MAFLGFIGKALGTVVKTAVQVGGSLGLPGLTQAKTALSVASSIFKPPAAVVNRPTQTFPETTFQPLFQPQPPPPVSLDERLARAHESLYQPAGPAAALSPAPGGVSTQTMLLIGAGIVGVIIVVLLLRR